MSRRNTSSVFHMHGYLSGARCRLQTCSSWCHCHSLSLVSVISRLVYLVVPTHPGSPGKRAVKRVCVCVLVKHWQKLSRVDSCNFMSILLLLWCVLWWLNWGTGTRRRHINMSLSCRVSEWAKQQWALVILFYYVCERYCRGQRLIVWCTPVCVCWTVAEWTCMARRIRDWLRRSLVIA